MAATDGYRDQADECRRLAEMSSEGIDRSAWLFLETAFMRLSDDAPKMRATIAARPAAESKPRKGRKRR